MSKKKIAYARKNIIDPEEEGEELPFEPREIIIHKDYWVTKDYELCEILGRGKFGEVKKCREISTGFELAAKTISTRKEADKEIVRQEIKIMALLRHPKVLQVYDAFEESKQMCIVTELVLGGELFDRVIDPTFDLTERVAILFMRQIVDGMAFVHAQNILHLDMKPENIICVAKTGTRVKIIDFGLAMRYDSFSSHKIMAGTIDFMAPEVTNYEDVSPATDMWSIGVICYVLVSGLSPFVGDDDGETICNIMKVDYDFAAEEFNDITAGCRDFIKKLLIKDSRKRMTAADCMKHSWLQKITRSQTNRHLSKKHHLKFFVKRKWNKAIKAVVAINRLEKLGRQHSSSSGGGSFSIPTSDQMKQDPLAVPDWRARLEARKKERENKSVTDSKPEIRSSARRSRGNHQPASPSTSNSSGYESAHDLDGQTIEADINTELNKNVATGELPYACSKQKDTNAPNRDSLAHVKDRNHLGHRPLNNTQNTAKSREPASRRDRIAARLEHNRDFPAQTAGVRRSPARQNRIHDAASRFENHPETSPANREPPPRTARSRLPGADVDERRRRIATITNQGSSDQRAPQTARQRRIAALASGNQ